MGSTYSCIHVLLHRSVPPFSSNLWSLSCSTLHCLVFTGDDQDSHSVTNHGGITAHNSVKGSFLFVFCFRFKISCSLLGSKSSTYVYKPFKIKSVRRVMLYIRYQQMFLSYDYVNKKEELNTTIINSCLL
jgi:hypothetical protein